MFDSPLNDMSAAQMDLYHLIRRDVVRRHRHESVEVLMHRQALLRNAIVPQTDYIRARAEHDAYSTLIARKESVHV